MTREEIALRILCALLSRKDATIDLYPNLGEKQIRTCFLMAETFQRIATEADSGPSIPLQPPAPPQGTDPGTR